jgi:hypothetical protein
VQRRGLVEHLRVLVQHADRHGGWPAAEIAAVPAGGSERAAEREREPAERGRERS